MIRGVLFIVVFLFAVTGFSQDNLPVPRNLQQLYQTGTRSTTGKPGANYWQNAAEYKIEVNFSPATLLLAGNETIVYTNNSPDTLSTILLKLYTDIYKKGAQRLQNIEPRDVSDGMVIDKLSIGKTPFISYNIIGTNMTVSIPPLLPKQKLTLNLSFHYTLNKTSHIRTGEIEPNADFIAYFFPRIAVYDDIDGWNKNQYLGTQEFYNDFCNFNVSVTVPGNFVVWATGDLKNCAEVFTEKYCSLVKKAEGSDEIVDIITAADLSAGNITTQNSSNTFEFEAQNVTDFAFALSDHYLWKSSSVITNPQTGARTRTDAVFNPGHTDFYDVVKYTRRTVEAMSFTFPQWPFPYSHITVFDGLDQMEYPMMVNDNPTLNSTEAITLTDHEVFHTMFPFYMGLNETKYGWMDEGWATLGEWLISPIIDSTIQDDYGMKEYNEGAGHEDDVPVTTLSTLLNGRSFFLNSYVKPALGYLYVKDYLGDKKFFKALHFFISQWAGKHPMPFDFFYAMNNGADKNLNWFWNKWFFETGVPDLAIEAVKKKRNNYYITVVSKGSKPVPVDLLITYEDNSTHKEHRSIEVWEKEHKSVQIKVPSSKPIQHIELGSLYVPDVNKTDNYWSRPRD